MSQAQDVHPHQPEKNPAHEQAMRQQLTQAILGGHAHMDAAAVFEGIALEHWGAKPEGAPHTLWQLLEHIRFTLHDLSVFSTDPSYKAPKWPDDYWPTAQAPANQDEATRGVATMLAAQKAMVQLVQEMDNDLFAKIAWGDGQTILREALLAATHTSYHLGQAMFLRKQLEG